MNKRILLRKNEYYDSIRLMRISESLRNVEGIDKIMVMMATPSNKQILRNMDFTSAEVAMASVNDMIVAIRAESEEPIERALLGLDQLLKNGEDKAESLTSYDSLSAAISAEPEANLCVISLPGEHAIAQARTAINAGLHVIIYSDNVSLEDDRSIKELASDRGLLCMGPDCGVVNLNGVAFLTASIVNRGNIGIVGASGSGTQLIAALIDQNGFGVSQAIGVGGKDLKDEVGGLGMLMAIDALEADEATRVVVIVSRAPGESTMYDILRRVKSSSKPTVVYFIDGDAEIISMYGGIPASDLEDAARKAIGLLHGTSVQNAEFTMSEEEISAIIEKEILSMHPNQKYLRGLYCGGTFCDEAIKQLESSIGNVYSNCTSKEEFKLTDSFKSICHSLVDLGDEEFTLGRPHPVIDPEPVRLAIERESLDDSVAVILMDFILGPAINPDPVGSVIADLRKAKERFAQRGGFLSIIASICGTDRDPQNLSRQKKMLEEIGVIVMPGNAQAARLAGRITLAIDK